MKLEEFIPELPTFMLKATGEKVHELRLPNLEDRTKFSRMFGSEARINEIFKNLEWEHIIKIVYALMIDKSDFLSKDEVTIDDDGRKKKSFISGPTILLRSVSTQMESMHVLGALTTALKNSEPLMREFIDGEIKKNSEILTPTIGLSSSISSPASTDILQTNSDLSPTGS